MAAVSVKAGARSAEDDVPVLLWDDDAEPPAWDGTVVLWRAYRRNGDSAAVSLPELVDTKASELRRAFLGFVYQVGETVVGGKRIVDHLELRPGLSYWWMTLIAQKDVYASSPQIYDVIKLFAFEEFARSGKGAEVALCSRNAPLAKALRSWCEKEGRNFEWLGPDVTERRQFSRRSLYRALPPLARTLWVFVKFASMRLRLREGGRTAPRPWQAGVTVADVFTHLQPEGTAKRIFTSGYWSNLVALLGEAKVAVNWLHWFHPHPAVPSLRAATSLASDLNVSSDNQEHRIVDSRVSPRVMWSVVRDFARLTRAAWSLNGVERAFRCKDSNLDLWTLFEDDWAESLRGPRAILSLFHLSVLEEQIEHAPHQRLGIYIQENQAWELALIHLWRAHGHGLLVGVAHSTVPFWDLRYVFDARVFDGGANGFPIPDVVALNGPNAIAQFAKAGYPQDRYREVEALRYLYLADVRRPAARDVHDPSCPLKVLVLGDLLPEYTERQIALLERCAEHMERRLDVVFKPHPAAAPFQREIRLPDLRVSTRHISKELSACDVVYVGSATSAAADAYQLGVPVVSVNEGKRINFSPLYGAADVAFVSTAVDLAQALSRVDVGRDRPHESFFTVDLRLPRWRALLAEAL